MRTLSWKQPWMVLMLAGFPLVLPNLTSAADIPAEKAKAVDAWHQKGIAPGQLAAIQRMGKSVLATKTENPTNAEDRANLQALRETVHTLLADEFNPAASLSLATASVKPSMAVAKAVQNEHHQKAKDLARRFRQRSDDLRAPLKANRHVTTEAVFNGQRAERLLKWSKQLEDTIAAPASKRTAKLEQLNASLQGASRLAAASEPRTPTLQSMPSDSGATIPVHKGE